MTNGENVDSLKTAAELGDAEAQARLAEMYADGLGVSQDYAEAAKWYRKAAEQGIDKAAFELGKIYAEGRSVPKDETEALKCWQKGRHQEWIQEETAKWYRHKAEQGDAAAQFYVGMTYVIFENLLGNEFPVRKVCGNMVPWNWRVYSVYERWNAGEYIREDIFKYALLKEKKNIRIDSERRMSGAFVAHVPLDYTVAIKWFRKAAEQEYAKAQFALGLMYADGLGVSQDHTKAARWYRKAAIQGVAAAQASLAQMYAKGIGFSQDHAAAARWYRKAAEQGHAEAQARLAEICAKGCGVSKDEVEAVKWFRKAEKHDFVETPLGWWRMAAEQGDTNEQLRLGGMYAEGDGVSQDHAEAARWFRKAADQGHAEAQYILGEMYGDGRGLQKDEADALKWWRKAAEQGHTAAQFKLGWLHKAASQGNVDAQFLLGEVFGSGLGVPIDCAEAAKWWHMAAEQGDVDAQVNLGDMYRKGCGVPQDYSKALEWYRKAAEQGDEKTQCVLGELYLEGNGVPKDETEAQKWLNMAAAQGNIEARSRLDAILNHTWYGIIYEGSDWGPFQHCFRSRKIGGALLACSFADEKGEETVDDTSRQDGIQQPAVDQLIDKPCERHLESLRLRKDEESDYDDWGESYWSPQGEWEIG